MPGPPVAPPAIFRILLPARDLARSRAFYESLLGARGRDVAGGRVYFDCGPVLLGLLDCSSVPAKDWGSPTEAVYFATNDLESVHARARALGALDPGLIHGMAANPAGEIVVRPWGERSFYATDPAGNSLCFVAAGSEFTGTPAQVAALASARAVPRAKRSAPAGGTRPKSNRRKLAR
jgi:catechol 2,3-dioxygenase-like lactoylglutathione lyase family enzyme